MPGWQRKNQVNETAVIKCLLKLKQKINSFITTVVKKIAISKKKKNSYHCDESAGDELEIAQVIWIGVRRRVDLKAIVAFVCQLQVSKNSGWDLALRVTGVGTIPCKVFCNISESSCVTPQ